MSDGSDLNTQTDWIRENSPVILDDRTVAYHPVSLLSEKLRRNHKIRFGCV